jgi:hypothetical protein
MKDGKLEVILPEDPANREKLLTALQSRRMKSRQA